MNINQGEIWEVDFFPNVGSEMSKKRPAVVVNCDEIGKLALKTIVPITNWSKNFSFYPWMIRIENSSDSGLSKPSAIDCFQIKNFSYERLSLKIGTVYEDMLTKIHQTIAKTLNPLYKLTI